MTPEQRAEWQAVAKLMLKDNPRRYTSSEVESVMIGCKQIPELQEPLKEFLQAVKKKRR